MFKNEKGFNLFTALIALMLLSISLVFVYNMIQTEETYLALINDQSKSSDLITLADLARADAFNNFVVSFREQYISHRNKHENFITLKREHVYLDWDSFVDVYAGSIFFDNRFEDLIATNIALALVYSSPPLGYGVSVPDYDRFELSEKVKYAFDDADEKITVVDCEQENNHACIGSLYFTLDFRNMSSSEYEKLPMVVVSRNQDGEVVQRPIFARREYNIYLPWRGFQAMRTVRNFALGSDLENKDKLEIIQGTPDSQGFFNPYIHYALNSAKLGVCDIDSCGLRTSLFQTASLDGFDDVCTNPPDTDLTGARSISFGNHNISLPNNNYTYNLQDSTNTINPIFRDLVSTTVSNNLQNQNVIYAGNNLKTTTSGDTCNWPINNNNSNSLSICNSQVNLQSNVTKEIGTLHTTGDKDPSGMTLTNLSPSFNKASNLGLYFDSDGNISIYNDEINTINTLSGNQYLRCQKINVIRLTFKFEEQDEKYIFRDDSKNTYIVLEDNYSKYSFYNTSYQANIFNNSSRSGYFNNNLGILQRSFLGWTCDNYEGATGSPSCVAP